GWNPGSDPMVETPPGSGVWLKSFSGMAPNSRHEFKITDGTWNTSFPNANSWLFADANGDITISYDVNTYNDGWSPTTERLGLTTDPGSWTATGDFLAALGGSNWTNNDPFGLMTPQGNGLHRLAVTLPPGNYEWKAVVTGSWDSISWDARSVNTANWSFTTDPVNNQVIFQVNAFAGTARIDVVPEPAALLLLAAGLLLRRR
ncbi:MAG: hypothetical protein AB1716_18760, partial [Planctomycetota bacterium]